jgi:hypothetical protein
MTVLMITPSFDPHISRIQAQLRERGVEYALLDMGRAYQMGLSISLSARPGVSGVVRTVQGPVRFQDIEAVWAPSPWPLAPIPGMERRGRLVVMSEWLSALRNFFFFTRDRFWVNPLDAELQATARIYQLKLAREVGLEVPATLITTDRAEFKEFTARFPDGAAGKRVGDFNLLRTEPRPRVRRALYTKRLRASGLTETELKAVSLCPCHLEEYIPKASELRLYVVGSRMFSAEIFSQDDPVTRVDWRRYPARVAADGTREIDTDRWRCRRARVPQAIREKILRLVRKLRLQYSAIDLIKTPSGRIVFLEANFGGVYAWIEDITGLGISDGIAEMLEKGK